MLVFVMVVHDLVFNVSYLLAGFFSSDSAEVEGCSLLVPLCPVVL